jgi:hypothetical protein
MKHSNAVVVMCEVVRFEYRDNLVTVVKKHYEML